MAANDYRGGPKTQGHEAFGADGSCGGGEMAVGVATHQGDGSEYRPSKRPLERRKS